MLQQTKPLALGRDYSYKKELRRLQVELVKLQEWVRHKGLRVVVLFLGRDAAGKGGTIKRITESLNPRVCHVVALGTPTERQKKRSGIFSATSRIFLIAATRPLRSQLVQPGGRRACDGLLHRRRVPRVPA